MKRLPKIICIILMVVLSLITHPFLFLFWLMGAEKPWDKFYEFQENVVPLKI